MKLHKNTLLLRCTPLPTAGKWQDFPWASNAQKCAGLASAKGESARIPRRICICSSSLYLIRQMAFSVISSSSSQPKHGIFLSALLRPGKSRDRFDDSPPQPIACRSRRCGFDTNNIGALPSRNAHLGYWESQACLSAGSSVRIIMATLTERTQLLKQIIVTHSQEGASQL